MNLIDIITLIGFFALGWILGSKLTQALLGRVFAEILKDLDVDANKLKGLAKKYGMNVTKVEADNQSQEQEVVEVKIEEHHGQLYAFRKDTDKFLGQGSNREELVERLKTQFAGTITLIVREADGADLIKQTS